MNLLRFAFINLQRRPARTALTLAAIALGIAALVALTSISWGFEASWQKANEARSTDLIVTRLSSENTMPSPFVAAKVQPRLEQLPHVSRVAGLLSEMLTLSDEAPPVFVFGWEHGSYLWEHLQLLEGRWPSDSSEPAVVLGSLAAELLHQKPGDSIEIEGGSFRIVGIFQSSALVENGAVLMTLAQAQQATDKPGKVNVLNIQLDASATEADVRHIKEQVRTQLSGFNAITSGELVSQNAVVRISKAMSQATILIASLVGALVVFNTMLMSISERTREIGLLLALGWQRSTVIRLIVSESVMLSFAGACLGIVLGFGLTLGLEQMELMRGKIEAVFSGGFLLGVLALSLVLGVLGGLYPALKAARLQPSHALRQE